MKKYILTLFFSAGIVFSAFAQETEKSERGCQEFKNGYFVVKEGLLGNKYVINREGNTQIETDPDGTTFKFNVNWVDECTYTLELEEIVRNPKNIPWQEGQVITVKILETGKDRYTQESVSNLDELTFVQDMLLISEKEAEEILGNKGNELSENY